MRPAPLAQAAAAIPQYNTMYMSTPVHVALELLRELLGYFTSDEMWRPRVEEAIQLVGCLPLVCAPHTRMAVCLPHTRMAV